MSDSAKFKGLLLILLTGLFTFNCNAAATTDSVTLFTPYTRISVPPGESINYSIDVINDSKELRNIEISVSGIPRSWNYTLTSGSYKVGQIAIMGGQKQTLSLKVDVPLKVNKGSDHGADSRNNSRTTTSWSEPVGCMAATYRAYCSYSALLRNILYVIYEKGDKVKINMSCRLPFKPVQLKVQSGINNYLTSISS